MTDLLDPTFTALACTVSLAIVFGAAGTLFALIRGKSRGK